MGDPSPEMDKHVAKCIEKMRSDRSAASSMLRTTTGYMAAYEAEAYAGTRQPISLAGGVLVFAGEIGNADLLLSNIVEEVPEMAKFVTTGFCTMRPEEILSTCIDGAAIFSGLARKKSGRRSEDALPPVDMFWKVLVIAMASVRGRFSFVYEMKNGNVIIGRSPLGACSLYGTKAVESTVSGGGVAEIPRTRTYISAASTNVHTLTGLSPGAAVFSIPAGAIYFSGMNKLATVSWTPPPVKAQAVLSDGATHTELKGRFFAQLVKSVSTAAASVETTAVLLSGGVGSAAVAAAMAHAAREAGSVHRVRTFSICFDGSLLATDVSGASLIAKALGTFHTAITVSGLQLAEATTSAIRALGHCTDTAVVRTAIVEQVLVTDIQRLFPAVTRIVTGAGSRALFGTEITDASTLCEFEERSRAALCSPCLHAFCFVDCVPARAGLKLTVPFADANVVIQATRFIPTALKFSPTPQDGARSNVFFDNISHGFLRSTVIDNSAITEDDLPTRPHTPIFAGIFRPDCNVDEMWRNALDLGDKTEISRYLQTYTTLFPGEDIIATPREASKTVQNSPAPAPVSREADKPGEDAAASAAMDPTELGALD